MRHKTPRYYVQKRPERSYATLVIVVTLVASVALEVLR